MSLVIRDGQLHGKVALDPSPPFDHADVFGDLEEENVHAIAVADYEDCVTRFCFFKGSHKYPRAESGPVLPILPN
jgi:hypothetical protein